MKIIELEETASTNSYLRQMSEAEHGTVVATHRQTAGRGQRGNSWESEPGANLTFSVLVRTENIAPEKQMAISRATSLAIVQWLDRYLPHGKHATIKWPNDIYVDDSKICGILIEHTLTSGRIERTIIGVGININQRTFHSDAPNPVSLTQLTGDTYPLDEMLREVASEIISEVEAEDASGGGLTADAYKSRMWRGEGYHPYRDAAGEFSARIADVAADGTLILERADGRLSSYAFKEVTAIL